MIGVEEFNVSHQQLAVLVFSEDHGGEEGTSSYQAQVVVPTQEGTGGFDRRSSRLRQQA